MSFRIKNGKRIIPYNTKNGQMGMSWLTSIEVIFEENEILETVHLEGENPGKYYRLTLGENPSPYDSYLILTEDVDKL